MRQKVGNGNREWRGHIPTGIDTEYWINPLLSVHNGLFTICVSNKKNTYFSFPFPNKRQMWPAIAAVRDRGCGSNLAESPS